MYYNKDYKMIYWIFDMDETLYQINGSLINYDEIKPNQELVALIKKLSGFSSEKERFKYESVFCIQSKGGV
jgi:hypothetical protein